MKVIKPETSRDVLHFLSTDHISKKKKTDAAIMAIVPMKNVKEVIVLTSVTLVMSTTPPVADNNVVSMIIGVWFNCVFVTRSENKAQSRMFKKIVKRAK